MKKEWKGLTTAQFARLHEVNKRTLHYYDEIGLFSPLAKGENGYRYYDASQSIDFEYIRMLKELNMTIEEMEAYRKAPGPARFLALAEVKERELQEEIQKRKAMVKILQRKKEQIAFCETLQEQEIRMEMCREEGILLFPYDFAEDDMGRLFADLKERWGIQQIRMGLGSFLSLDKVYRGDFSKYDGVYTPALSKKTTSDSAWKPRGRYVCGYQKGLWEELPKMYEKILEYAKKQDLKLTGYAYEVGLNDFAISDPKDYVTKIMIRVEE